MKRRFVIRLCVFLVLGTVVNVAIAFGATRHASPVDMGGQPDEYLAEGLVADLWDEYGENNELGALEGWRESKLLVTSTCLRKHVSTSDRSPAISVLGPRYQDIVVYEVGFPFRFVELAEPNDMVSMLEMFDTEAPPWWHEWIENGTVRWHPGFAINTFFYAAILWLLFAAPGRVRRWRRIRRGLCAKCAYPVGASDVCTECGAAISSGRGPACE